MKLFLSALALCGLVFTLPASAQQDISECFVATPIMDDRDIEATHFIFDNFCNYEVRLLVMFDHLEESECPKVEKETLPAGKQVQFRYPAQYRHHEKSSFHWEKFETFVCADSTDRSHTTYDTCPALMEKEVGKRC